MSYAIAVGIYLATYFVASVLPLLLGSSGSVIQVVIFSIPILLVGPRVAQRFTDGQPLLPKVVRSEGGLLYAGGIGLIWLGHLVFFGSIGAAVYLAGVPIGIFAGYAMYPYLVGIVLVELAFRQWSNRQFRPPWKSQRNSIYITVGVIVAAQLLINLTSGRPVDLLSYSEREALAWGNGFAREVKRKAEKFYIAEKRMPCVDDNYIDVDSLLRGTKADRSKALSIEILDCGRFVATIHRPIDGIADGQLLFVASPGDADAGMPLNWQCFSAHHERIERHTNGGCTYDPSLSNTSLAPVDAPATVSTAASTAAPSSNSLDDSGPSIQDHLDRLAEPTLWENCGAELTSYRLLKFNAGQYAAAVRISHDTHEGAYRTATSSSPNQTRSMDGYVGERTWKRIDDNFVTADFWSIRSERNVSRPDELRIYLEACKNGRYYAVERDPDDAELASIVRNFTMVGKFLSIGNASARITNESSGIPTAAALTIHLLAIPRSHQSMRLRRFLRQLLRQLRPRTRSTIPARVSRITWTDLPNRRYGKTAVQN